MKYPRRIPSDLSLTTITEEPSQYSSTEIVVQPEVIVETSLQQPKDNNNTVQQQYTQKSSEGNSKGSSKNVSCFNVQKSEITYFEFRHKVKLQKWVCLIKSNCMNQSHLSLTFIDIMFY